MSEKELLEEKLYDIYMSKRPLSIYENTVENHGKYQIEIYLRSTPEDKKFISTNRWDIKKFFDKGYEDAGLGRFMGCNNEKAVKDNTSMLKVARDVASNTIIAMTIYSSHWGGFKCVGGTVIGREYPELRALGIQALRTITREDVHLFNDFIWTECSGKIEEIWESCGGIRVPSAYLSLFMDEKTLSTIELPDTTEDPYSYTRTLNKGTADEVRIQKVIFGFANKDVLEKYIQDTNTSIEELYERTHSVKPNSSRQTNESHIIYRLYPENIQGDLRMLELYKSIINQRFELTEKEIHILTDVMMNVFKEMEILERVMSERDMKQLYHILYQYGFYINKCSILKPYMFGEYLEKEKEWFPTDLLMPTAF